MGKKWTCLLITLAIVLVGLLVILVLFFAISSMFDLGIWEEFWEKVLPGSS